MEQKEKMVTRIKKVVIEKQETEKIIPEEKQGTKKEVQYAFILNDFFQKNFSDPAEVLDKSKGKNDRERRVYVCLKFEWESNTFFLPLRRDLGNMPRHKLFKKACYPVPSTKKPKAGLDFRKIVIINDESLYRIDEAKISSKQKDTIQNNFDEIKTKAISYIEGFKKAAKKGRQKVDSLYKFSALNNFLEELGIEEDKN
ncbi:hypothetical protein [Bacillus subtilis]|uniref:hypothetical protein n=1 Tax=Bacillus subtilis TaxID=1423 RepID=UPI0011A6F1E9|nr:hypothetical protein [Bacillus subtilis]TWG76372.1 hypothetical protein L604_004100000010 [Bacillus subtilis J27]